MFLSLCFFFVSLPSCVSNETVMQIYTWYSPSLKFNVCFFCCSNKSASCSQTFPFSLPIFWDFNTLNLNTESFSGQLTVPSLMTLSVGGSRFITEVWRFLLGKVTLHRQTWYWRVCSVSVKWKMFLHISLVLDKWSWFDNNK